MALRTGARTAGARHEHQPPEQGPAWRWLWAALLASVIVLAAVEAIILPDMVRAALEFGAAFVAIAAAVIPGQPGRACARGSPRLRPSTPDTVYSNRLSQIGPITVFETMIRTTAA